MIKKVITLFIVFVNVAQYANCQTDCVLKKSRDSIFIYACNVPSSNLKSIKANFTINTKESILAACLMDVAGYHQWQYHNIATRVLNKISASEVIYHSEIAAPWPVTNRDLIMHLKITQDSITKIMTVEINGMPEYMPPLKDFVRVPIAHAKWIVTPIGKNLLQINYTFLLDPGGFVPAWVINLALADGPYETFKNIKAHIKSKIDITPSAFIID